MTLQNASAIEQLVEKYIDGLHHADSKLLRSVFHPDLLYVNATEGDYRSLRLVPYLNEIDQRVPPSENGESRHASVQKVEFATGRMASVWASIRMMGRDYQDLLTMIKTQDGWRIIAKVFTYQQMEG